MRPQGLAVRGPCGGTSTLLGIAIALHISEFLVVQFAPAALKRWRLPQCNQRSLSFCAGFHLDVPAFEAMFSGEAPLDRTQWSSTPRQTVVLSILQPRVRLCAHWAGRRSPTSCSDDSTRRCLCWGQGPAIPRHPAAWSCGTPVVPLSN